MLRYQIVVEILFIGNRELHHTSASDKKIYRISQKASSSSFTRYTVEVWWCTKDKSEGNNRLLRASTTTASHACSTIMKKGEKAKIQKKGKPTRKGKREREKIGR